VSNEQCERTRSSVTIANLTERSETRGSTPLCSTKQAHRADESAFYFDFFRNFTFMMGFHIIKNIICKKEADGLNLLQLLAEIFHPSVQTTAVVFPIAILAIETDEDANRIEELYLKHKRLLYKIAWSYFEQPEDVEDAVGDAILNVCQYAEKFRPENCNNPKEYLLSIMGNVCRTRIMKSNRWDRLIDYIVTSESIEDIPDDEDPFSSIFDYSDAIALLDDFEELSDVERDLIQMKFLDSMSYQEMADIFQKSEAAVRSAVCRAKQHLRRLAQNRKEKENEPEDE